MSEHFLQTGDVIELKEGHKVFTQIPMHFVFSNRVGSFELTAWEVLITNNFNGLDTRYLCGKYVVVRTTFDGGGTGTSRNDIYPSGHHVFCEKIVESKSAPKIKVNFYQSGSMGKLLTDIEPIGHAELTYKIES